ncbi:HET-domain-containing protein [Lophium mytilinum]|uniref:HET-domain-containing protein n=1 Tax=Lophium mytilinum TaxID=390894 RepID=A0A6A6REI0_9PEZI|nr:HET-domain-containing protein [Lophium mytilinum]
MDPYEYLPLEPGHIRVLTLLPQRAGEEFSAVRCTMQHMSLDAIPSDVQLEIALSYVWGPPTQEKRDITVNERTMTITASLCEAMACQRGQIRDRPPTIWIDAICINQADSAERSSQVSMMEQIHSQADATVAWLGPPENDSDIALKAILRDDVKALGQLEIKLALSHLLLRKWFQRTWVIQEVVLAKTVYVASGLTRVPWDKFFAATKSASLSNVFRDKSRRSGRREKVLKISFVDDMRKDFWSDGLYKPSGSLSSLLAFTKRSEVTDPRDAIYGVLGLASKRRREAITVDYSLPFEEVYQDAMTYMLTQGNDWHSLTRFPLGGKRTRQTSSLPSWVPDFSDKTGFLLPVVPYSSFATSRSQQEAAFAGLSVDKSCLNIRGQSLGTLHTIVPYAPRDLSRAGPRTLDGLKVENIIIRNFETLCSLMPYRVYEHAKESLAFVREIDQKVKETVPFLDSKSVWNLLAMDQKFGDGTSYPEEFEVLMERSPVPSDSFSLIIDAEERILAYCLTLLHHVDAVMRGGRCFFVAENGI